MNFSVDQLILSAYYGKVFCEKSWRWNTVGRPFDDYDLWYVYSGEGELTLNGVNYPVTNGSCFIFRPGDETIGSHNPQKPLTIFYSHFSLQQAAAIGIPSYIKVKDISTFEMIFTRYVHSRIENRLHSEVEAQLLLALLLLQLDRESTVASVNADPDNEKLTTLMFEVASYVRQFPSMMHNVAILAERARLSPRYFSRKFKEIIGQTVESYIIEAKINRAENLLRFNGMNVTEVADALGYRNIYFFSRQFKQIKGVNPSQLRNR